MYLREAGVGGWGCVSGGAVFRHREQQASPTIFRDSAEASSTGGRSHQDSQAGLHRPFGLRRQAHLGSPRSLCHPLLQAPTAPPLPPPGSPHTRGFVLRAGSSVWAWQGWQEKGLSRPHTPHSSLPSSCRGSPPSPPLAERSPTSSQSGPAGTA